MNEKTQILLVEGNDDFHLISNLCDVFNINESFDIKDSKGIDQLLQGLPIRLKGSGLVKTIGIVVDADANTNSRWQQIKDIIIKSNLYDDIPNNCPINGAIIEPKNSDDIKIGIWIMPDNNENGMLEDFVAFLIPQNDDIIHIVDSTLENIETLEKNKYKLCHHSKARIHTWLAWQEDPGIPMGLAIKKKYLTTTPPICQNFVDWLNRLFN